jgi:hypothetical protein
MTKRRWAISSIVLGSALILGIVSSFLPWRTEHFLCSGDPALSCIPQSETTPGTGWAVVYFFLLLNVAVLFLLRLFFADRVALPVAWLFYLIGGIAAISVALDFLSHEILPSSAYYSARVEFGWPLASVGATAICAAALLKRTEPQPRSLGHGWATIPITLGFFIGVLLLESVVVLILLFVNTPAMV